MEWLIAYGVIHVDANKQLRPVLLILNNINISIIEIKCLNNLQKNTECTELHPSEMYLESCHKNVCRCHRNQGVALALVALLDSKSTN